MPHSRRLSHCSRVGACKTLHVTYRAEGCEPPAASHIHAGEGVPAERHHHSLEAFVCDVVAVLQAEGAQRCEPSQHAQPCVTEAASVEIQDAQPLQVTVHEQSSTQKAA